MPLCSGGSNRLRTFAACTASLVAVLAGGCAKVVPSHAIPVKPEYIEAGVLAGDRVEITTSDGREIVLIVEDVANNAIKGQSVEIAYGEIQSLVKRSWTAPTHPCGGDLPLGCSIPEAVLILSKEYSLQADKFHDACVSHDFCYRHGFATYGAIRDECDTAMYDHMKQACKGAGGLGVLDVKDYGKCLVAANRTYDAIRRHGEQHFQTTSSTYCEYREEPSPGHEDD